MLAKSEAQRNPLPQDQLRRMGRGEKIRGGSAAAAAGIGGGGLYMTLSQSPCISNSSLAASACCSGSTCAHWSGFSMASRACIMYGSVEAEMAVSLPAGSGSILYLVLYIGDPSWDEVDIGITGESGGTAEREHGGAGRRIHP